MAIAKKACAKKPGSFVALDMGPTGKLLAPYGDLPFEEAVSIYAEIVQAGVKAGADLILIETMSDTLVLTLSALIAGLALRRCRNFCRSCLRQRRCLLC